MNSTGQGVRYLLFTLAKSHIWLGICAIVFTLGHQLVWQFTLSNHYYGFLFFGTILVYTYHGYYNDRHQPKSASTLFSSPSLIRIGQRLITPYLYITGLLTAIFYLTLPLQIKLLLLPPILLASSYIFPVYKQKRIKEYGLLKLIVLVLVWTYLCFVLPNLYSNGLNPITIKYGYIGYLISFFTALGLLFDLRDQGHDRKYSIRTLPLLLGPQLSKILAILFLCMGTIMGLATIQSHPMMPHLLFPILSSNALIIFHLYRKISAQQELYYPIFIDGILLLFGIQLMLIYGFYTLI